MNPLLLLLLSATAAFAQQTALAHPVYHGFYVNTPLELTPGMRVLVTSFDRQSNWFERCLNPARLTLQIYPLGFTQAYRASILVPVEKAECISTVHAVVPNDIPMGPAEAVLSDGTGTQYLPAPLRIVPVSFGVLNEGLLAIANRVESEAQSHLGLTTPALPGTVVALRTAGLGNARRDRITVQLGETTIAPRSIHPAQGEPGLDDIEFVVPQELSVTGCYVPVLVRLEDRDSNLTSIPTMQAAGPCKHRFGLSKEQLENLEAGGHIPVVDVGISSDRYLNGEEESFDEGARASSGSVGRTALALIAGPDSAPLQAGCRITENPRLRSGGYALLGGEFPQHLDPGNPLTLSGPGAKVMTLWSSQFFVPTIRFAGYRGIPGPSIFPSGTWNLRSSTTGMAQPIDWSFRISSHWEPDNLDALSTLRSGVDPVLSWDGALYDALEWVTLILSGDELRYQLECRAPATAGSMRVDVTSFLKAFDTPPLESFEAQISLAAARAPASPYVFPLNLADGTPGLGLLYVNFRSIRFPGISVQ
ncbi:MAG: hypothetical protein IT165_26415 [Bryobacterales bacterium]|nr:hypothetical protein [Bryobacterales bacterium]